MEGRGSGGARWAQSRHLLRDEGAAGVAEDVDVDLLLRERAPDPLDGAIVMCDFDERGLGGAGVNLLHVFLVRLIIRKQVVVPDEQRRVF